MEAFAGAVRAELSAESAVEVAKNNLRLAISEQARLVAQLMASGLTSAQVAHRAAAAAGRVQDIGGRLRLAARLRKRVSRFVTRGHGVLVPPPGPETVASVRSDGKEATMAIVHRKTVVEWIEDPELDSLEDVEEDTDDEDGEDENTKRRPSRR
ncbi:MAG: hypothetical protein QM704_02235 [Anaeromyxobacteraceae bacterium]